MRLSYLPSLLATISSINGLNILITNDDGFGTANIREMYKAIKAYGHNAWIVASTSNESGTGGTAVYTTSANLTADTEFGIVKKGQPSVGTDPNDSHIWYYNGTPSACVQVALDYVFPNFTNVTAPDLVMSGVNYGWNLGPFLYTLSGTIGATYTAIERGIPGIAFSGGYSTQTPYFQVNSSTRAGLKDPATIQGQLAANLSQQLIANANNGPVLPTGYGISVNIPYITSFSNTSCVDPPFIHSRLTGGADVDGVVYNPSSGLFAYKNVVDAGLNTCINGDCSLPGETNLLNAGCQSSVSVFTVDYDAPQSGDGCALSSTAAVRTALAPLVQYANSSATLVGGLNGTSPASNASATGSGSGSAGNANSTTSTTPAASSTLAVSNDGTAEKAVSWTTTALSVICVAALNL